MVSLLADHSFPVACLVATSGGSSEVTRSIHTLAVAMRGRYHRAEQIALGSSRATDDTSLQPT